MDRLLNMGQIYKAINKINGMIYIGKTIGLFENRKKDHITKSLRHINNTRFHNAIRKYGIENFNWELLEECPDDILNDREIYYISISNSCDKKVGYNMTLGGENDRCNCRGKKWSKKRVLEKSNKVYQYSIEGALIREWGSIKDIALYYGIDKSVIYRCCYSNKIFKGYIWRIYPAHLSIKDIQHFHIIKDRYRKVLQYDLKGHLLNEFKTIKAAADACNIDPTNIHRCCNGHTKTSAGFIWRYSEYPLDNFYLDDVLKRKSLSYDSIKKRVLSQHKPVIQYDLNGVLIKEWSSQKEALEALDMPSGSISRVCRGIYKTAGGYIWKFKEI